MIPFRFTDSISSAIRSSSNSARGFALLGRICASGTTLSVAVMTGSSFREQRERSVLERGRLGGALEARLLMAPAGGRARWLDVIDVRRDGLQRAPTGAGDVRKI